MLTTINCARRLRRQGLLAGEGRIGIGEERWVGVCGREAAIAGGPTRPLKTTWFVVAVDAEPRGSASNPANAVTVMAVISTAALMVRRLRIRVVTTRGGRDALAIGCMRTTTRSEPGTLRYGMTTTSNRS
jgi:hypothetical protein